MGFVLKIQGLCTKSTKPMYKKYKRIVAERTSMLKKDMQIFPVPYVWFNMKSRHSSMSHFGVLVAPQIPMVLMSFSQSKSISSARSI